jgi:hypothetical protein
MTLNEIAKMFSERYPKMKIEDFVKFLYLGTMGNSHIIDDINAVKRKLSFELLSVIARDDEPMFEELTPDTDMIKLNLRPYKDKNGTSDLILSAMLETAETFEQQPDRFKEYCGELLKLTKDKVLPFTQKAVKEYLALLENPKFSPIHHSEEYKELYRPAYRVIKKSIFDEKISLYILK